MSPALGIVTVFNLGGPSRLAVIFHCGFNFIFLTGGDVEHLPMCCFFSYFLT